MWVTLELGAISLKTAVHEIGHVLDLGEADDRDGEIFSGDDNPVDRTPETLQGRREWSEMASGWDDDMVIPPIRGRYFAFSIEELSTIQP